MKNIKTIFSFLFSKTTFLGAYLFISLTIIVYSDSQYISQRLILSLQKKFDKNSSEESSSERRREYKKIVRSAESLIVKNPLSKNRFELLGLIFQSKKEILILKPDVRGQKDLIDTCNKLLSAPDEYAILRFQAEILLNQWSKKTLEKSDFDKLLDIAGMADKYKNTSAELDCAIVCANLAFNLGHQDLLKSLRHTIATKFSDNPKAVAFLKDRFNYKSGSLLFKGKFKYNDGSDIVLPIDKAGHAYLSCFWSNHTRDLKKKLLEIKKLQEKNNFKFDVLSFNLDELPDAGKKTLDLYGLNWKTLHLPDGNQNQLFKSMGSDATWLVRITNANGYVITTPIGSTYRTYGRLTDLDEYVIMTVDKDPYLAMIQSLRIGEFLITNHSKPFNINYPPEINDFSRETNLLKEKKIIWNDNDIPSETLKTIQKYFITGSSRYKLSENQVFSNYKKVSALCHEAIKGYPLTQHKWVVLNRHIIALLGLWNLSSEAKYLDEALSYAKIILKSTALLEAQIVAKFCLAKVAIREANSKIDNLIQNFLIGYDPKSLPPSVIAAVTILSLDATSPRVFPKYRELVLDNLLNNTKYAGLSAYLYNKFVISRLFRGNYYSAEVRGRHGFRSWQKHTELRNRFFNFKLNNLKGEAIVFPNNNPEKTNVMIFLGTPKNDSDQKAHLSQITIIDKLSKDYKLKNLNLIYTFIETDIIKVKSICTRYNLNNEQVAIVPNGINNPHIQELGILLADERPNTFLVNHDKRILWSITGMYHMATSYNAITGVIKESIVNKDLSLAKSAFNNKNFRKALSFYQDSFPPSSRHTPGLWSSHMIELSKTHIALNNYQEALNGYKTLLAEHHKKGSKGCACSSLATQLTNRANLKIALDKNDEANADKVLINHLACPLQKPKTIKALIDPQSLNSKVKTSETLAFVEDALVNNKDGKQEQRNQFANILLHYSELLSLLGKKNEAELHKAKASALSLYKKEKPLIVKTQRQLAQRTYTDIINESNK